MPSFPCYVREKYLLENSGSGISEHPGFKIFWGACPQTPPSISHLRRLIAQPPTFVMQPVTSKLTESTDRAYRETQYWLITVLQDRIFQDFIWHCNRQLQ